MRIGLTAAGQRIQAPFEWDEAKPCPPCQGHVSGGLTSPTSSATHSDRSPHLGLRKTSPGSISA
jgi:hypothetical protein